MTLLTLEEATQLLNSVKETYSIEATGNCVAGDTITFIKANWERVRINRFGKLANRITGYTVESGYISNDSYGGKCGQHTFTIRHQDGSKTMIKGRNLYAYGVLAKPWEGREEALQGKYASKASNVEARQWV